MAKATPKKAAPKKAATAPARPTAAQPSRAVQAAAHQGRPAPSPDQTQASQGRPDAAADPTHDNRRPASVPATVRTSLPADPAAPSFMQSDAGRGTEAIGQQDMSIPRLKLMQGLSKELEQYEGLRAGNFFHVAQEYIFDAPFRIVPIFIDKRYILWKPLQSGGGILARADDGVHWNPPNAKFTVQLDKKDGGATVTWETRPTVAESGLANWGTLNPEDQNSPPAATLMYSYLVGFPDHPDLLPAVMSMQRSSIKAARNWNTKLKTIRAPIYGTVWSVGAVDQTNAANQDFKNFDITGAGFLEDADLYEQYKAMNAQFSRSGMTIRDIEESQVDETSGNHGDQPGHEPHQQY